MRGVCERSERRRQRRRPAAAARGSGMRSIAQQRRREEEKKRRREHVLTLYSCAHALTLYSVLLLTPCPYYLYTMCSTCTAVLLVHVCYLYTMLLVLVPVGLALRLVHTISCHDDGILFPTSCSSLPLLVERVYLVQCILCMYTYMHAAYY